MQVISTVHVHVQSLEAIDIFRPLLLVGYVTDSGIVGATRAVPK